MLLNLDGATGFLELGFGGFGFVLGNAFQYSRWCAFDQSLGFRQAQTGFDFAHSLDDLNLFPAVAREDNVEFGLLFSRRGIAATTTALRRRAAADVDDDRPRRRRRL